MNPDSRPTTINDVNGALSRIERAVRDNPEIRERTAEAFAGVLLMEASMGDRQVAIRLPEDWLERAETLVPIVAAEQKYEAFGKVKRSTVLRMAVAEGLRVLEAQYAKAHK